MVLYIFTARMFLDSKLEGKYAPTGNKHSLISTCS